VEEPRLRKKKPWRVALTVIVVIALGCAGRWSVQKYFGIEAHALAMRLWPPQTADKVAAKKVHEIAGWFAQDCGHVRHRQDADASISCVHDALRAGRRFRVAFDWFGFDSHGTVGLAANSTGVYEVDTEEYRYGLIVPTVTVLTNVTHWQEHPIEITLFPASRILSCVFRPEDDALRNRFPEF
jgi:hypothetical protein